MMGERQQDRQRTWNLEKNLDYEKILSLRKLFLKKYENIQIHSRIA